MTAKEPTKDLSKWQFRLMTDLTEKYGGFIPFKDAHFIKQGTFGSFLNPKRGYLKWVRGRQGWRVTEEALRAKRDYLTADISRLSPQRPLTHYFDPTAYGLAQPKSKQKSKGKSLRIVTRSHAA